jgi:hypothetical protein
MMPIADHILVEAAEMAKRHGHTLEKQLDHLLQFALGNFPEPLSVAERKRVLGRMAPPVTRSSDSMVDNNVAHNNP